MVSQPLPPGELTLEQKPAPAGERAPTPGTGSHQKAGRNRSPGNWAQRESQSDCTGAKEPWLLFQLPQRFDSVGSGQSHRFSVMGKSQLETSQDNMGIWSVSAWRRISLCSVPAGPWLGRIQSSPRLQL